MPTLIAVFEAPMAAPWPTVLPAMVTIAVTAGNEMPPPIPMASAATRRLQNPERRGIATSAAAIRAVPATTRAVLLWRSASPPKKRWRPDVERAATEISTPDPAVERPNESEAMSGTKTMKVPFANALISWNATAARRAGWPRTDLRVVSERGHGENSGTNAVQIAVETSESANIERKTESIPSVAPSRPPRSGPNPMPR